MAEPLITHYDILDVPRDATPEDIKSAYRRAQRNTHPDATGGRTAHLFKITQDAWECLSDPLRRAEYDRFLRGEEKDNGFTSEYETQESYEPPAPHTTPSYTPEVQFIQVPKSAVNVERVDISDILESVSLKEERFIPRVFGARWFTVMAVIAAVIWSAIGALMLEDGMVIPFAVSFAIALAICLRFALTNSGRLLMSLFVALTGFLAALGLAALIQGEPKNSLAMLILIAGNTSISVIAWARRRNTHGTDGTSISVPDAHRPRVFGVLPADPEMLRSITDRGLLSVDDLDQMSSAIGTLLTDRLLVDIVDVPGVSIMRSLQCSVNGVTQHIGHVLTVDGRAVLLNSFFVDSGQYRLVFQSGVDHITDDSGTFGIPTGMAQTTQGFAEFCEHASGVGTKEVLGIMVLHPRDENGKVEVTVDENSGGVLALNAHDAIRTAAQFLTANHTGVVDRRELGALARQTA